ncbi:hypothetical protein HRbin36_02185 [bacterium HR36]|nr:hypothetical protein HRbin36_02185 [bacterium HR36]
MGDAGVSRHCRLVQTLISAQLKTRPDGLRQKALPQILRSAIQCLQSQAGGAFVTRQRTS